MPAKSVTRHPNGAGRRAANGSEDALLPLPRLLNGLLALALSAKVSAKC